LSAYTIGIKTGDGLFYPVLEESFKGKKRFVLTTINDNQTSVQIDFYRSINNQIEGAEYIGSLVIENIESAPKKVPEIEVILGVDSHNSLHAVARNLSSEDDKQSLTVSLESLSAGLAYDIPEFELDEKLQPTSLFDSDKTIVDTDHPRKTNRLKKDDKGNKKIGKEKSNLLKIILFVIIGLIIAAALTFGIIYVMNFLNKSYKPGDKGTSVTNDQSPTEIAAATAVPTAVVIKNEIKPTETPQPVIVKNTNTSKKAVKGGGYWYTIKKGDTLWDIAERTYGNPWSYYSIYRSNRKQIRNPDLIFSGNKIYLPKL